MIKTHCPHRKFCGFPKLLLLLHLIPLSLSLGVQEALAGQIPSHIYMAMKMIPQMSPACQKLVHAHMSAYLLGAQGPDTVGVIQVKIPGLNIVGTEPHYVRTGALVINLLYEAATDDEKAFALGWATHYFNDRTVHNIINRYGGFYELHDEYHKKLEQLETKYVLKEKGDVVAKWNLLPDNSGLDNNFPAVVLRAYYRTFPVKSPDSPLSFLKAAETRFLDGFWVSARASAEAANDFLDAHLSGTGRHEIAINRLFPQMPSNDDYELIMKPLSAEIYKADKEQIEILVDVNDTKLFRRFLKEWDDSMTSAISNFSGPLKRLCAFLDTTDQQAREAAYNGLLRDKVLPNVNLDMPSEYTEVLAEEKTIENIWYDYELIKNPGTSEQKTERSKSLKVKLPELTPRGFDGNKTAAANLYIPTNCLSGSFNVKIRLLENALYKNIDYIELQGSFGTEKIITSLVLSNDSPALDSEITARVKIDAGKIPDEGYWQWQTSSAVEIVSKHLDTAQLKVKGKGTVTARLYRIGSLGSTIILSECTRAITPKKPTPAEKPPAGAKKPADNAPVEKPPVEKPTGAEAGAASPSSGTAAGGYWKMTDVKDIPEPSPGYHEIFIDVSNCTVRFSGSTMSLSAVVASYKSSSDRQPFTRTVESKASWTELPKTLAPGDTVSTTIRFEQTEKVGTHGETLNGASIYNPLDNSGEGNVQASLGKPGTLKWGFGDGHVELFAGIARTNRIEVSSRAPAGQGKRIYTYTWTAGPIPATAALTAPISGAFNVDVKSDKPTPKLGDTVTLSAKVTGGTAPYKYTWTGPMTGTSSALPFTVSKPGRQDFIVTVVDAKGAKTSAAASVEAKAFTATIAFAGGNPRIPIGQTLSFRAQVSSPDGAAPPAGLVYRWQPNPEVTFAPFEDTKNATTGRFPKMGKVKVWVDVLQKSGTVLSTIAESNQLEIEVVKPEISLRSSPAEPKPGQEVRITASESPAVGDAFISFWWEYKGNVVNQGALADPRVYTYKPKDTAPVTVTIHGKAKDGGDDLGQQSITVSAKPYEVKIDEPRLMGPPPRVWSEKAKGLVEVPRAIGTFQDFYVKANISPQPPDPSLRYTWQTQPEGCSIYSPASQETRGNASQAGSFTISVTVRDNQDITLGSGSRTVSIVAPTTEPKKTEPAKPSSKTTEAIAKLKEANALAVDGKLDEAIVVAQQAAALDPNSKPISSYLQQLKATKAQQSNLQQQNKAAAQAPTAPPQSKTAEAMVKLKEASALAADGKLDEAIVVAEQAAALDPNSKPISSYLQQLKATKAQQSNLQQQNKPAAQSPTAPPKPSAPSKADQAAAKVKQAYALAEQNNIDEALAVSKEAVGLDPTNAKAVYYVQFFQACQHFRKAHSLVDNGRLDEAAAEVAEAKKDDPTHPDVPKYEKLIQQLRQQQSTNQAAASQQAAIQAAKQHLNQALSLGKADRLDEADAEVAAAKAAYPSHPEIPTYENWLKQRRQQLANAKTAAASTSGKPLSVSISPDQPTVNAGEKLPTTAKPVGGTPPYRYEWFSGDNRSNVTGSGVIWTMGTNPGTRIIKVVVTDAAGATAMRQTAVTITSGGSRESDMPPAPKPAQQGPPELAGTSWNGEAALSNENMSLNMPIMISIAGNNQVTGTITLQMEGESQRLPLQGTYDPQTGVFNLKYDRAVEDTTVQGTLVGKAKSSSSADGQATLVLKAQGFESANVKGSWHISRR